MLVDTGQVAALLDYDSMMLGHRVHDLAAGAVKLATRFRSWDPPPPGARKHLLAGYRSVALLTAAEEQWFEAGVACGGTRPDPGGCRSRRLGSRRRWRTPNRESPFPVGRGCRGQRSAYAQNQHLTNTSRSVYPKRDRDQKP